jgi:hypothetical protein
MRARHTGPVWDVIEWTTASSHDVAATAADQVVLVLLVTSHQTAMI